ncbi:MAG TPA: SDR family NAD(P)-dependent oxidoreductase [Candidatus Polarisedimenticolia bacterium]|nr:SDR family NAD(P)-dependent oxidoreductase [Candidatus Polarisedimenticolia bacterium]
MGSAVGLEGRRALVTGGGRGIGRAVALALATAGADVAVAARTGAETTGVAAEIAACGRRSLALAADVTDPAQVAAMAAAMERGMGSIDILVNAAGDAESALMTRTDLALWNRMIAVNLTAVFLCTSRALPGMLQGGWGRVISVASNAGLHGYAYVSAYCAAKHGVVGFTRAVAQEVAGKGVTINALCPGYVDTEMTRRSAERISAKTGRTFEDSLAHLARSNPSGRLLSPSEVAAAALRLAGAGADGINGEALPL